MRNCGNCVYKDLKITEEPCDSCNFMCNFMCNWEKDEEEEVNEDQDNI